MLAVVTLLLFVTVADGAKTWDYDHTAGTLTGPANWPNIPGYESCNGTQQSPIDIITSSASVDTALKEFKFTNYEVIQNLQLQIINNGHSAQVTPTGVTMTLNGGGLSGDYTLWQFHFHWGASNTQGSEHKIDGTQYALELHLVHYKNSYGNATGALASKNSDALAVLGFMFDIGTTDNPAYVELVKDMAEIQNRTLNHTIVGATFDIDHLFEDALGSFYRYQGSLTTPACDEVVIWSVFENRLSISQAQLDSFRNLLDDTHSTIEDNYRYVQPLNGRVVTKYDSSVTKANSACTLVVMWQCLVLCLSYLLLKSC